MSKNKIIIYLSILAAVIILGGISCYWLNKPIQSPIITTEILDEITITTDKTEYELGEAIKIITKNNSSKTITLVSNKQFNIEAIERLNENTKKWEYANNFIKDVTWVQDYPPPYEKLESNEERVVVWNQKSGSLGLFKARPGKYRTYNRIIPQDQEVAYYVYSNVFIITGEIIADNHINDCTYFTIHDAYLISQNLPFKDSSKNFRSPYNNEILVSIPIDQKEWPECEALYESAEDKFWILCSPTGKSPEFYAIYGSSQWYGIYRGFPCKTKRVWW